MPATGSLPFPLSPEITALASLDVSQLMSLRGRTALVTGAGSGLGQAISAGLAAAGADVILLSEQKNLSDSEALVRSYGRDARQVIIDLGKVDTLQGAFRTELADAQVDILVNCAGIIRRQDASAFADSDWYDVLDVNLNALFILTREAGRQMLSRRRGKVINIASMLSFQGGIRTLSYAASKHAVVGVTRALANEWAHHNVQVNAIAPGYFATRVTSALRSDEQRNHEILARIPAGRWGQPADLVGAAVFLSSTASDYVNGHVLAIDGGWLAR
ncbi:2-dehydro-3-deoxy-D-gluconate 5-dehydrogenase KduD [Nonomuraea fuscirosea]|uniref:2-dehydro-3-deoxy-D-gluconate 5-dehydrogenase KduD n=1 Tax=Nonomuraea fuscirosea TaxID=1291556 RepID=UPI0033D9DC17